MASTTPQPGAPEPDWTDQVTDLVVDVVDTVRDKATGPVLKVARQAVYGTIAFFVVLVMPLAPSHLER